MRAIRCVFAILLLLPAAAFAQAGGPAGTVTSSFQTVNPNNSISVNIGKSLCQGNQRIDFAVDFTNSGSIPTTGVDTLTFFITKTTAECTDPTNDPPETGTPGALDQQTVRQSYLVSDFLAVAALTGGCNDTTTSASKPATVFFCSRRKTTGIGGTTNNGSTLPVNFALNPPVPPSVPTTTAGDRHLRVSWTSNDSGDRTYDVFVVPWPGFDPDNPASSPPAPLPDLNQPVVTAVQATSVDVEQTQGGGSLQNSTSYAVYVRSTDGYKNQSNLSAAGNGTPIFVEDFYNHYRNENGTALGGGGCASGGSDGLALLGALGVLLPWRRRRAAAAALLGALVLVAAPAAKAEAPGNWTGQNRPNRYLLVAFKVDRYAPGVDAEKALNGATPYLDIFHKAPLRYQLEVDWEVAHPFGSILVGGTAGFWQNYGKGLVFDQKAQALVPSSDTTHLNVLPVFAVVTYRFDVLADRFRYLPVIPYVQAGLGAALWASYNGRGDISTPAGAGAGRGSGWTRGYCTALGVAVSLDAIDAQLAREAYVDMGVQRTSIFAEYGWTRLDGFGSSRGELILSDRAWRFGASVEF